MLSRHARARSSKIIIKFGRGNGVIPRSMSHLEPKPKIPQPLVETRLPQARLGNSAEAKWAVSIRGLCRRTPGAARNVRLPRPIKAGMKRRKRIFTQEFRKFHQRGRRCLAHRPGLRTAAVDRDIVKLTRLVVTLNGLETFARGQAQGLHDAGSDGEQPVPAGVESCRFDVHNHTAGLSQWHIFAYARKIFPCRDAIGEAGGQFNVWTEKAREPTHR